tara:strand:- start:2416 stop:4830 length:2415 start_codon:yes stop_codon:yes gene_type:complete
MLIDIIKKYKYPILFLVIILILFWKVVLNPSSIIYSPNSDIIDIESVWNYVSHENYQKRGNLALWNPDTLGGKPHIGFYAPSFFNLAKLPFLFFPIDQLFGYLFIFYYFLAALFMYLFLKLIGLDKFSSFIGALVYALSGRFIGYVYLGHSTIYATVVAVPLTLIFFELLIQRQKIIYAILTAGVVAFQFYGAHTQYFFFNVFFLFAYFAYRFFILIIEKKNKRALKLVLYFFIIGILTFLFSAQQLLPFLETTSYSSRSNIGYEYASNSSLPPWHLITLLFSNFFGSILNGTYWGHYHYFGLSIYIGVLPLVLAALSFFKRNKYTHFFLGFAVFSLLYAFGKYFLVHPVFYSLIPGFDLFRAPERMLFFFNFSMAVLSGFGTNLLLKGDIKKIRKIVKVLVIIAIVSLVGITIFYLLKSVILSLGKEFLIARYTTSGVIHVLKPLDFYVSMLSSVYNGLLINFTIFSILLILVILFFILYAKNNINKTYFKVGIVLIILIDLFYFGLPYIDVKDSRDVFAKSEVVTFLERDKSIYRILDLTIEKAIPQHIAVRHGIQKVLGFDSIILSRYNEYISTIGGKNPEPSSTITIKNILYPKMVDLLNAKYILSEKNLEGKRYKLVYSNNKSTYLQQNFIPRSFNYSIYLNKNFIPRSFIVHKSVIKKNYEVLEELKSQDFDPREYIILEEPFKNLPGNGSFKEAQITDYSPNRIAVEVFLDTPGFLVLSEYWYPGWKAYDNGIEVKIYKANYIFRAVYLDEGRHKVDFVFEPKSLKIGFLITITTLLIVVLLLIAFWIYKKKFSLSN